MRRDSASAVTGLHLSICFDDFPETAGTYGAAILQDVGARGTYYVAAGLLKEPSPAGRIVGIDVIQGLSKAGHEIGCHSHGHKDCTQLTRSELLASLDENQRVLGLGPLNSFAYPFGYSDWSSKSVLAARFQSVRTTSSGLNQGHVDLAGLKAVPLYEHLAGTVDQWLDRLGQSHGWLILYTHDVSEQPSKFGCTPSLLARTLDRATRLGCRIDTVGATAARLQRDWP